MVADPRSAPSPDVAATGDLRRCPWAMTTPDYIAYHDREWGRPVHGDDALYERLTLEAFQSGLSWLTILRKRPAFRAAFSNFNPAEIAAYTDADVERLLADASIVRNRAKVLAAITNAKALTRLHDEEGDAALDRLIWSFAPDPSRRTPPRSLADVPAKTPESAALARELKRRGFAFVGATTVYATMQACGIVNDHLIDCAFRAGPDLGQ